MHFRFVPGLLCALGFGERIVQALEPGISLAGTSFGFRYVRFETREDPMCTSRRSNGKAASHLGESRLVGTVGRLCPALKEYREAG
jgi:hypothetical protein